MSLLHWIILTLVAVTILFIISMFRKRSIYKQVEQFEEKKNLLLNGNVPAELAKVKQLKLTGETEKKFYGWRDTWDAIVTEELPKLEEKMFDAEEAADKYQFRKAGHLLYDIRQTLQANEEKIQFMLAECQELVGSEEKNREEIEELKASHQALKKTVLVSRTKLGSAVTILEQQLEEIDESFLDFHKKTNDGNYFEARDVLLSIESRLHNVTSVTETLPELRQEFMHRLPDTIDDLKAGCQDMEDQSYYLDHLQPEESITKLTNDLEAGRALLDRGEVEQAEELASTMKKTIDSFYEALEKEVYARHFTMQEVEKLEPTLVSLEMEETKLKDEVHLLQASYTLDESELQEHSKMEKDIRALQKRFQQLVSAMETHVEAPSALKEELVELQKEKERIKALQKQRFENYQTLRSDEHAAIEALQGMKKKLVDVRRLVHKSNVPGVPSSYINGFEKAEQDLGVVEDALKESPLHMTKVNESVEAAQKSVDQLYEASVEMVDQAFLVEQLIQYGNKYRNRHPQLGSQLKTAEESFRKCNYELALEQAAAAVEAVEPGALKKMEEVLEYRESM